jgi:BolA protein
MNADFTGPVAREITRRLNESLSPTRLELTDDSAKHHGHSGHNPEGESHFSLLIESAAFAGHNRVARQRLVYRALGELMDARVHALAIRAVAPGE